MWFALSARLAGGVILLFPLLSEVSAAHGGVVTGRVQMTDFCSPTVSPAVVFLERADLNTSISTGRDARLAPETSAARSTRVVIVNLSEMQFTPRVTALAVGQTIRFTNLDQERHLVRVAMPGLDFSESIGQGQTHDLTAKSPGVFKLECGIHLHMRGFVIASPTPWFQVCSARGDFRIEGVPAGRYILTAWHEMGEAHRQEITLARDQALELPTITLSGDLSLGTLVRKEIQSPIPVNAPVRPWSEPLDGISVLLAAARNAVTESEELRQAQRLVEDAYWGEFEASDLESAVRLNLGYTRASSLVTQFTEIRRALPEVAAKRLTTSALAGMTRRLLLALVDAARDLKSRGVIDNSRINVGASAGGTGFSNTSRKQPPGTGPHDSPALSFRGLKRGLHRVQFQADRNVPEDAASTLTTVFLSTVPPLKNYLLSRNPQSAWWLDREFHLLRGELAWGLKGDQLTERLEDLSARMETELGELESRATGALGPVFAASIVTILAEGALAALLLAVVVRLGVPRAWKIWSALCLAMAAGAGTALELNRKAGLASLGSSVGSLDGWGLLIASFVLLYGGRRLLSSAARKRTMDSHETAVEQSTAVKGLTVLCLAASLVVYRATTETMLIYQAMLARHAERSTGLFNVLAGAVVGLGLLCLVAWLIRALSLRLAPGAFLKVSVLVVFALALALAGNAVFELQNVGAIDTTLLGWLNRGIPLFGVHPSLEVFATQVVMTVAAVLSCAGLLRRGNESGEPAEPSSFLFDRTAVSNTLPGAGR
jgi:high-affinity iron transporter